ncbi:fructose-6-phosphate aldolase [Dolosigranulum pigrum]|uniref:fructose-6-phosphate aldolase n=1 Tax=Dolosigranulum pigrum TaxID=29394 RepID=UPI001AD86BCC|nr:fructose-6-phosphate aldolase [Dolosigranulum pigrum]QTJ53154.1 fructose-6-phosphate aldolase [Dolosigranulum pigrum]
MKLLLDSISKNEIEVLNSVIDCYGVTSNPTIVKKHGKVNLFEHLKEIKKINVDLELHVQVVGQTKEKILKDAKNIVDALGSDTFIKVPVDKEGLCTIKELKKKGYRVTATAIYSEFQAILAVMNGADYIAPYINRMSNMEKNTVEIIKNLRRFIDHEKYSTQILAASFKNIGQVTEIINAGAHGVTVNPYLINEVLLSPTVNKAIDQFVDDWEITFNRKEI